jgi:exonuclease SbcC
VSTRPLHFSKIELMAFRGIERVLPLDFGRRLTIIYGGNATGKSSIAQAIEFAISGRVRDQEDGLITGGYLPNTRGAGPGSVSLTLDEGTVLFGATDHPLSDIERRFREVGAVDWPERQPLPITTTHITTQGMLARVLGNANAVTRNDLSGLCAGAYLRSLVSRAQELDEHFRQASSGRNMQAELRHARANYDTAKLLHESLRASSQATDLSSTAIDSKLRDLNAKLNLPELTSLVAALSHLDDQVQKGENVLRILEGLLARTRELGQHEAELAELKKQRYEASGAASKLQERKAAVIEALAKKAEQFKQLTSQRTSLLDVIAAHERHQQSVSAISALEDRLREVASNGQRAKEDIQILRHELEGVRSDLLAHSTKLAQLRQARQVAEVQRNAMELAIAEIIALPADHDSELERRLEILRQGLNDLERSAETTSRDLKGAREKATFIGGQLSAISRSGERFLAVSTQMRSFLTDSHCPLCGHDHGSAEALAQSMERVSASVLSGADELRREFEGVSKVREEYESRQVHLAGRIEETRVMISELTIAIESRAEQRRAAISRIERSLKSAGLAFPLETEVLRRGQNDIAAAIARLDQEIRDCSKSEGEDEARRFELERALAAKSSEGEQLQRLAVELNEQAGKARATLGAGSTAEEIEKDKADLAEIEPLVKALDREQGQTQANLFDLDRAIADKKAEVAGVERRTQAVEAFLNSLDAELNSVGASRDIRSLVDMQGRARQQRDNLVLLKTRALEIEQEQRILEESRAILKAREQLNAAEQSLRSMHNKQRRLQERSAQFKSLHEALNGLQEATAEIVLEKIRKPVGIIFQAMTAGCPWDIEFRLEDGKVSAVLTGGSARDVAATSVLNSAYVNVAAIALRLALASQQRWTRLRTVVFDDPILEMDNLTQSALIDGLEAVLTSSFEPWEDLQFVLTTWSEDFAVMAAHKLAHLNDNNHRQTTPTACAFVDNFVIHHLSLDLDGKIVSERHVPHWRKVASAA